MKTKHPQFDFDINEKKYYSSELNQFIAESCRTDMVVNDIDLIIRYYKDDDKIRIIECKHLNEKFGIGQFLLLEDLQKRKDINTFILFGDYPFNFSYLYVFANKSIYLMDKEKLKLFVDNKLKTNKLNSCFIAKIEKRNDIYNYLKSHNKCSDTQ